MATHAKEQILPWVDGIISWMVHFFSCNCCVSPAPSLGRWAGRAPQVPLLVSMLTSEAAGPDRQSPWVLIPACWVQCPGCRWLRQGLTGPGSKDGRGSCVLFTSKKTPSRDSRNPGDTANGLELTTLDHQSCWGLQGEGVYTLCMLRVWCTYVVYKLCSVYPLWMCVKVWHEDLYVWVCAMSICKCESVCVDI